MAGLLLLPVALAAPAPAQLGDFEARLAAARASFVQALEDHAGWCQEKSLFEQRRAALELVLELEPEHAAARKALGYSRDRAGNWVAPARARAFRDFDQKALAEAPGRLERARTGYVELLLALLEEPGLSFEQHEGLCADVLRVDPDNPRVHAWRGEVKGERGWVLPETLEARARREELRALVRAGLEGAPRAAPVALVERERLFGLPLSACATERVRVVGTAPEEDQVLMAQALHGLEHLLRGALGTELGLPRGCTVFLLDGAAERTAFLAHHPAITPAERALYELMEGAGIQGTADFAFWTGDAQRKIDGIVRLVQGYMLTGAFELTVDQGWAYEGFGILLARSLVRSRMTWLAQPASLPGREQDFALRQRLIDPETNWIDEAHQLLSGEHAPDLEQLFRKGANQLTTEDVLASYALATYLLEAQPGATPRLLALLGRGVDAPRALQEILDLDLETFRRRLLRWLSERT